LLLLLVVMLVVLVLTMAVVMVVVVTSRGVVSRRLVGPCEGFPSHKGMLDSLARGPAGFRIWVQNPDQQVKKGLPLEPLV
jgi:hypothetical protein